MNVCMICGCPFDEHNGCPCGNAITREQLAATADALSRDRVLRLAQSYAGRSRPYVKPPRVRIIYDQMPEPRA